MKWKTINITYIFNALADKESDCTIINEEIVHFQIPHKEKSVERLNFKGLFQLWFVLLMLTDYSKGSHASVFLA